MSNKFIIYVDENGEVDIRDGSNQEIPESNQGVLTEKAMNLGAANKLIKFDSLAIMGVGADRLVTMVCVKRADCRWYCS